MGLTLKDLQKDLIELRKEIELLKLNKETKCLKKKLEIGDTFSIAGLEWKILDITEKGYVCLAEKLENEMKFDSNSNDWKSSDLRNYLNGAFLEKIAVEIGEENIISFERDLLSLDSQNEYGVCEDKVSLLNVDEYRKYRNLIPNAKEYWWWLITPDSTKSNGDSRWVRVVLPSGDFSLSSYRSVEGVRPFCIFASEIFESEE